LTPLKFEYCQFFRRILGHMQNGFSPWIGALGGVDLWKNEGRKSRALVPLDTTWWSIHFTFHQHPKQTRKKWLKLELIRVSAATFY
jgi:hypothetical protein